MCSRKDRSNAKAYILSPVAQVMINLPPHLDLFQINEILVVMKWVRMDFIAAITKLK